MNEKHICFSLIIPKKNILQRKKVDFFENFTIFTPTAFAAPTKSIKFNEEKLMEYIIREIKSKVEKRNIRIWDNEDMDPTKDNTMEIVIKKNNIYISGYLQEDIYIKNKKELIELIEKTMINCNGVQATLYSFEDNCWQNVTLLDTFFSYKKSIKNIVLKPGEEKKDRFILIDIEKNPGHYHIEKEMWFGSCYMMWFGQEYFNYVPEEGFKNFKECHENIEIGNGIRRITLYEDIYDYENPENRKRQWAFREATGIDEVAHAFGEIYDKEQREKLEREGPTVVESMSDGVLTIKAFMNDKWRLTPKNLATHVNIASGKVGEAFTYEKREKRDDD